MDAQSPQDLARARLLRLANGNQTLYFLNFTNPSEWHGIRKGTTRPKHPSLDISTWLIDFFGRFGCANLICPRSGVLLSSASSPSLRQVVTLTPNSMPQFNGFASAQIDKASTWDLIEARQLGLFGDVVTDIAIH